MLSTYDGAAWLPAQLASLRAQTHPWRLLWRDDGSRDGTVALMRAQPDAIEAEAVGRLGVLGSFMALLREARGPVAFCDQDDVWLPDKLARGAAAVAGDAPVLYCARQRLVDGALRPLGDSPHVRASFPAALTQNIAAGCTIVMNEAAARRVAAMTPPPGTLHDWWSYLAVSASGGRIVTDAAATILYRQHAANAVGAPVGPWRRARAAIRRGPEAFMAVFAQHVRALLAHDRFLTDAARADLIAIEAALRGGSLRRLRLWGHRGLVRQTAAETALFRLWLLLG